MVYVGREIVVLLARIYFDLLTLLVLLLYVLPKTIYEGFARLVLKKARPPRQYKSILITGASVGIGAAFAREYAGVGVFMTLTAYQDRSLEETVQYCIDKGAVVVEKYVDVKDRESMQLLIEQAERRAPLDLVIANAGITARIDGLKDSHNVFETNLLGMLNTIIPAVKFMRQRKKGKIILMSSMGAHAAASNLFMTPYIATKAAIKSYGAGLRASLRPEGIEVNTICPGFTESRMTEQQAAQGVNFHMLWPIERAMRLMKSSLDEDIGEINFPFLLYLAAKITGNVPPWFQDMFLPFLTIYDPYYSYDKRLREAPDDETREMIVSGKLKDKME